MDAAGLIQILGVVGGLAGAVAALCGVIFGQRSLLEWRAQRRAAPLAREVIHNLPDRPRLIGRQQQLADLTHRLGSYPITVIQGAAGVGKSTLALELAHQYLDRSSAASQAGRHQPRLRADGRWTVPGAGFSGLVWLDLRYRCPSMDELATSIGLVLDRPEIATLAGEEKRVALHRALSERPSLIVVDNLDSLRLDTVPPLLEFLSLLPSGSHAVVTTRAYPYHEGSIMRLHNLDVPQTLAFARQEAQRHGLTAVAEAPDSALADVFEVTGGSPLAIGWLIGQVAHKGHGLDVAVATLRSGQSDLFRNLFSHSWTLLGTTARRMLVGLTVFRTNAALAAIAAAAGAEEAEDDETENENENEAGIGQLVELGLTDVHSAVRQQDIRYSLHPLTHLFARSEEHGLGPGFARLATRRLISYYLGFLRERGEDAASVEPDVANVLYLITWCAENGEDEPLIALADAIHDIVFSLGLLEDRVHLAHAAADAAKRLGRPAAQAHFISMSAGTNSMIGRYGDADRDLLAGLHAATAANSPSELAEIRRCIAFNSYRRGAVDSAAAQLEGVAELAVRAGDWHTYVDILCLRGAIEFHQRAFDQAQATQTELARVLDDIGWERGKSYPPRDLAELHMIRREYREAHQLLSSALEIAERYRDERQAGRIEMSIAKLMFHQGRTKRAMSAQRSAKRRFERAGMLNELRELEAITRQLRRVPWFLRAALRHVLAPKPRYSQATIAGD